jgi:hypothetical protein
MKDIKEDDGTVTKKKIGNHIAIIHMKRTETKSIIDAQENIPFQHGMVKVRWGNPRNVFKFKGYQKKGRDEENSNMVPLGPRKNADTTTTPQGPTETSATNTNVDLDLDGDEGSSKDTVHDWRLTKAEIEKEKESWETSKQPKIEEAVAKYKLLVAEPEEIDNMSMVSGVSSISTKSQMMSKGMRNRIMKKKKALSGTVRTLREELIVLARNWLRRMENSVCIDDDDEKEYESYCEDIKDLIGRLTESVSGMVRMDDI